MRRARTRRRFLRDAAALAGAGVSLPMGFAAMRAAAAEQSDRLLLLGTQGGPNFLPERSETASAVIVDGVPYLIDCGYGTLAALIRSGLGYRGVANVFLTHLHDDHTADLAAFLSHQWTGGRIETTTVHGPAGTAALVDAALEFGAANAAIRLVDEARTLSPRELVEAVDVAAAESPVEVFEDGRVSVTAVENSHYPAESRRRMTHRSVAYRFDTGRRTIVFSGDTAYSSALVTLARGADVLVCEAMDVAAMRRAFEAMVAEGAYADNPEGIWRHIVDTHTSTADAGRMAREAGVGLLVLNHLIPGALGDLPEQAYVDGVRGTWRGDVVVGRDLMEL
ncbi:MAG: MBL fold metallo-hydrolase [Gammaproteobacteria bacterium]|nr:MBL fold metallo-hydrolase [Gammaproteobacteria bacterium]